MSDNNTNIYLDKNIFKSLSVKDLKIIIQEINTLIKQSVDQLSNLFSKPRNFVKSDYSESNRLLNAIINLREISPSKELLEEISEFDKTILKKENNNLTNNSKYNSGEEDCYRLLNQAKEIREKFNSDYSEIIKDIQYHDITKQKLEHVIEINDDIIRELNIIETNNYIENGSKLQHIEALKEIMSIEIAQLIYSSELCKTAIQKIANSFEEQSDLILESKRLTNKLKTRIFEILQVIEKNEKLTKILTENKDKFSFLNQIDKKTVEEEISKALPVDMDFDHSNKTYNSHIEEITHLTGANSSFFETLRYVIESLKKSHEKLFKDRGEFNAVKESNLDFLKRKYTMNSEHKIHELALENQFLKGFFSEMTESEEDNDVEFF